MSILIKDLHMPKWGMVVNIYADGRVTNHFDEFGKTIGKAVSVPEPHGRLIDADSVFDNLERTGWYDNADRDIAEDLVLDAPTFIPAEEGE